MRLTCTTEHTRHGGPLKNKSIKGNHLNSMDLCVELWYIKWFTSPRSRRFRNKLDDPFPTGGVSASILSTSWENGRKSQLTHSILSPDQTLHNAMFVGITVITEVLHTWRGNSVKQQSALMTEQLTFFVRDFHALLAKKKKQG